MKTSVDSFVTIKEKVFAYLFQFHLVSKRTLCVPAGWRCDMCGSELRFERPWFYGRPFVSIFAKSNSLSLNFNSLSLKTNSQSLNYIRCR